MVNTPRIAPGDTLCIMKSQGERLAHAIRLAGYKTKAEFAEVAGVGAVTLRQQINRDSVPAEATELYARKLRRVGVTTEWLLFGKGPAPGEARRVMPDIVPDDGLRPTVAVHGFVGAGDEVHEFDDTDRMGDEAAPPRYENGAAVIVRGDSMRPLFQPGDILFYNMREEAPKTLPRRAVIVKLTTGELYLKKILPGTKKGLFHLISVNPTTPEMLDRHVHSIARIGWIKPADD